MIQLSYLFVLHVCLPFLFIFYEILAHTPCPVFYFERFCPSFLSAKLIWPCIISFLILIWNASFFNAKCLYELLFASRIFILFHWSISFSVLSSFSYCFIIYFHVLTGYCSLPVIFWLFWQVYFSGWSWLSFYQIPKRIPWLLVDIYLKINVGEKNIF